MIILDTNVLSALMRKAADKNVVAWLDKQPSTSIWTTSVTILEINSIADSASREKKTALRFD